MQGVLQADQYDARKRAEVAKAMHGEVLRTDFLFIFPRVLKWLRWIEPLVSRLPLGGQYLVLGRKPGAPKPELQ